MSISALTDLAVTRDNDAHEGRAAKRKVNRASGEVEKLSQSARGVLSKAIPTEVLAGYTAIVGVVVGTIKVTHADPSPNQLVGLRWGLFGGFLAFTSLAVVGSYLRKRADARHRKLPFLEVLAATIAAAAWGLVMPGNPLVVDMSAQVTTIATTIITIVGGGIVASLSVPLAQPSNAHTE